MNNLVIVPESLSKYEEVEALRHAEIRRLEHGIIRPSILTDINDLVGVLFTK